MSALFQDFRYGLRTLRKTPTFTILAVGTLSLGIAVNATLFSLVNILLFDELPIRDPDSFTFKSQTLTGVAAFLEDSFVLTGDNEPCRVAAFRVSDNFHDVWGIDLVAGRGFRPGEDRPGSDPVTILSHGFWKRQFGSDPGVVGRTLRLDGTPYTVIGVLSPKMEIYDIARIDLWVPLDVNARTAARDERRTFVTARFADGVSVSEAREEVRIIGSRLAQDHPDTHDGWSFRVSPTSEELISEEDSALLLVSGLSVSLVLLIACANVANMLLAQGISRSKEVAVRLAMGADRLRLLRQFLTEGFLLSAAAAVLGLFFTRGLLDTLVLVTAESQWLYRTAAIDGNVLLFTLGVSALTPFVFGLLPSLRASRPDLTLALKEGGRTGSGRLAFRWRGLLVGAQIAMALILMVVTGLLVRTVIELRTMNLGFQPEGLLAARVDLPQSKYPTADAQRRFLEELVSRTEETAGVRAAAVISQHPLEFPGGQRSFIIQGTDPDGTHQRPTAYVLTASAGYFRMMQIPLLRGRAFDASDTESAPPVALVNKTAVVRYWPEADPIGTNIRMSTSEQGSWIRIVGIVGSVVDISRRDETTGVPQIYLSSAQQPTSRMALVARAVVKDPSSLTGAIRSNVAALDPDLVAEVRTMPEIKDEIFASANAIIVLFLIFAAFALVMASMGIYGVVSYSVSERHHEISIRMALGASAVDVLRMISKQGMKAILVGGAIGLCGALLVGPLLSSVVIGISTTDPLTFLAAGAVVGFVAFAANYVPARRATRIDPIASLRTE
jgi:putative ABC transport system permease protein